MKADGLLDTMTERVKEIHLTAQTAADEFLMTEILRLLKQPEGGKIVIANDNNPEKHFVWSATGESKG